MLVTPFDQGLLDGTTQLHEAAIDFLERVEEASPVDPPDGDEDLSGQPGFYGHFKDDYANLLAKTDALLVRAVASSQSIDDLGWKVQDEASDFVAKAAGGDLEPYQGLSLTAQSFVDLRLLFESWRSSHELTGVRSKAVWQVRRGLLAQAILAIETFENFKRDSEND